MKEPEDEDVSEAAFRALLIDELPEDALSNWEWHDAYHEYLYKDIVSIDVDYDFRSLLNIQVIPTISLIQEGGIKYICPRCACDRWRKSEFVNHYLCGKCGTRVEKVGNTGRGVKEGE